MIVSEKPLNSLRICLVNPPIDPKSEGTYEKWAPHLGLGYLASYLLHKNLECKVVDAKFEGLKLDSVASRIQAYKPHIVGITMMTEDFGQASLVAKWIKEIDSTIITIVGGPHPTAVPSKTLHDDKNYDVAVWREGELTLYEIAMALREGNIQERLGSIRGIAYKAKEDIIQTEPRPFFARLDELSFPAWQLFPVNSDTRYPLITGRGCPYRCIFCQRPYGNKPRLRSVENILAELEHLVDNFDCKNISFFDETFTLNRRRILRFLDAFIANGYSKIIQWDCETRVDHVDQSLLRKMREAGCHSIGFGIESGNENILTITDKGTTKEQAQNAVKWAKDAGLFVQTYFILGYPFETEKTANDTIRFAKELDANSAEFSLLTPFPGTKVLELARQGIGGLHLLSEDYRDYSLQLSEAMEIENLPLRKLKRLQLKGYLIFYLRPKRFLTLFKLTNIKRWPKILLHFLR